MQDMLDELQEHVESIDMANDLHSIGGLVPLLGYLKNAHANIRAKAAEVVSTIVQNNPRSQQLVMEANGLEPLLSNFTSDPDVTARTKALGAISSLIRHNKPGIAAFRLANGYAALRDALSSESPRFQRKALNLIHYLLHENRSDCNVVTELGFPRVLMHLASSEDGEVREGALRGLLELAKDRTGEDAAGSSSIEENEKLKQILLERIEGISSMSPEDLGAAKEERQLVDSLWNTCYNEPSSLREKGLVVLPGDDASPPPDVAGLLCRESKVVNYLTESVPMEVETSGVSNFNRELLDMSSCELSELRIPHFRSSDDDNMEFQGFGSPVAQCDDKKSIAEFPISPSEPPGNGGGETTDAAKRVQKVYRSYRTRRMLADSAVVAEELWWQAIDYARLNHSTISFFNYLKPETAFSRWNRVGLNASKVGKGLSKDAEAQILAFQHWIEAIDPRHRYGHNLHIYYEEWCKTDAGQPFFFWLDLGDGRKVDLKECPRAKLQKQCIKYLGPQERQHYEYIIAEGQILHKLNRNLLDTTKGPPGEKWIFVMSTSRRLYAGVKKKGMFHHSSFLAGGAALAAGRLVVQDGTVKSISPYSGHYRPTDDSLETFLSILKDNGVNVDEVDIKKANEDYDTSEDVKSAKRSLSKLTTLSDSPPQAVKEEEKDRSTESIEPLQVESKPSSYQRTLSGGLQSPRREVPKTAILERINSKKSTQSYQLGHQLSRGWSTGAGPRIGCIADYPAELRWQALELTNVSPKPSPSSTPRPIDALCSPTCSSPVSGNVLVKSS